MQCQALFVSQKNTQVGKIKLSFVKMSKLVRPINNEEDIQCITEQFSTQQTVLFTFPKVLSATVTCETEAFHHFFQIQPISQVCVDVQEKQMVETFFSHCLTKVGFYLSESRETPLSSGVGHRHG